MAKSIVDFDILPRSSEDHIWADYIEILCLFNVDGVISKADILDRVRERSDLGGETDEIDSEIIDESSYSSDLSTAEIDDRYSLRVDDWFKHLVHRIYIFKTFYPFILSDTEDVLYRKSVIDNRHRLYIFLLLASDLRRIKIKNKNPLTDSFEVISREAMRRCLPENAQVHIFSRNPLVDSSYPGHIWRKLEKLALDLGGRILANEEEFSSQNTADEGLDIVGWVSIGDSANGILLVFGQCACTTNWPEKQHSSSATKWREIIHMKSPPTNMIFIPFCFRHADGSWCKEHKIQKSILLDRPRLLHLLQDSYELLSDLPYYGFVNDILVERDDLF